MPRKPRPIMTEPIQIKQCFITRQSFDTMLSLPEECRYAFIHELLHVKLFNRPSSQFDLDKITELTLRNEVLETRTCDNAFRWRAKNEGFGDFHPSKNEFESFEEEEE